MQSRREGVKGVTVSRGPGLKRGPQITKTKEKWDNQKETFSFWALNLMASRAPKLSGPMLPYSVHLKGNLQVGRGPVNIGFTGPGQALDAPENSNRFAVTHYVFGRFLFL